MVVFGWTVLGLVFLDELLAMAAYGVWGWQVGSPRALLVVLLPLLAMAVWALVASPRARYGGGVARPVAKVVVLGLACAALADAGHVALALALVAFSVVVNGLALHPRVAELPEQTGRTA